MPQAEAHCRMLYRSESGREAFIWNSRDGVTPFFVVIDGEEFQHKAWQSDRRLPDYVPEVGSYVFVDLTLEKAMQYKKAYVEKYWDDPEHPMREHPYLGPLGKDGAALDLAKADVDSFGGESPDLVKVTQEWLEGFLAGRRNKIPQRPPTGVEHG